MSKEDKEMVADSVHYIGKIDRNIYKCVTKDIITDEVIITEKQIEHIKENHPTVYENYGEYFKQILSSPDYIIEGNKPNTAVILKSLKVLDKELKVVLRLVTSQDDSNYKNSIITFIKIDKKDWDRLLRNKKILYKSE